MMKSIVCILSGAVACLLFLAGCVELPPQGAFVVRGIDPSAAGGVKVKLTSAGDYAEADENLLVAYVKIVAIHEATKPQRQLGEATARRVSREMAARQETLKSRYLAVKTERSAPGKGGRFTASVILWDTHSESMVGGNVYDIQAPPAGGRLVRFDTYSAEYVGGGH